MAPVVTGPPPPVRADGRRGAVVRVVVYGVLLAITLGVAFGVTLPDVTLCAFQIVTGRPCPGCGMTRSIVHLAQGDVLLSLRFHPLGILLAAALVLSFTGALLGVAGGRDHAWAFLNRHGTRAALLFLVALVGLWAVRGFLVPEWAPDPIGVGIWGRLGPGGDGG